MNTYLSAKKIIAGISVFCSAIFMFENCSQLPSDSNTASATVQDTHLGELMGQMQYYTVKLGLALQHRNQPLANFYVHEVDETYTDIASKKIMIDSFNVSKLIAQILLPKKEILEGVIARNDTSQFDAAYHGLISGCNSCHHETQHPFIVIEEPLAEFNGQNFSASANPLPQ